MPPGPEAERSLPPPRRSQVVHERIGITTTPRHRPVISMERVSTGGSRYATQFRRSTDGPMSGAERAKKKRVRASLCPQQHAAARKKDRGRKRDAKERAAEDSDPEDDGGYTQAEAHVQQYRMKVVQSCVAWMVCALEQSHEVSTVDQVKLPVPELQHVYHRGVWMPASQVQYSVCS